MKEDATLTHVADDVVEVSENSVGPGTPVVQVALLQVAWKKFILQIEIDKIIKDEESDTYWTKVV